MIDEKELLKEIEGLKELYGKCRTRNDYEDGLKDGRQLGYIDSIHKVKSSPSLTLWHDYLSNEDDTLREGEKVLVVYENSMACPPEIISYNTDVWTDEIVRWARLDDILKFI